MDERRINPPLFLTPEMECLMAAEAAGGLKALELGVPWVPLYRRLKRTKKRKK